MMRGVRVLVVEDETLLAEVLVELLLEQGFEVAGPGGTIRAALEFIATTKVDAAILDVRLFAELSFPVAYRLRELGIPFMFLTTYRRLDLPVNLRCHPLVEKPFDSADLVRTLSGLLPAAATADRAGRTDMRTSPAELPGQHGRGFIAPGT